MEVNLATDENSIRMEPTILIPRNDEVLNSEYTRIQNQISSSDENLFKKYVDATKKFIDEYNLDQVPAKCRKYVQEAIIKTERRMEKELAKRDLIIAKQAQIIEKQAQEIAELKALNAKLLQRVLLLEAEINKLKSH